MADKTMNMSNFLMEDYINVLSNFLDRKDVIGYAAARNYRRLADASLDYSKIKSDLLTEYGSPLKDENGNDTNTMAINRSDPNFDEVKSKLELSGNIRHDVTIFTITYEDVINELTGNEILQLDWMIEEASS